MSPCVDEPDWDRAAAAAAALLEQELDELLRDAQPQAPGPRPMTIAEIDAEVDRFRAQLGLGGAE
jgi:hypothetical protein